MPLIESWVVSANSAQSQFPLNNLPYGRYLDHALRLPCTAIGDQILDLRALERTGLLDIGTGDFFQHPSGINAFMEAGSDVWSAIRTRLIELLSNANVEDRDVVAGCLRPMQRTRMAMPFDVAEFTDFYSGKYYAINVGTMFRGAENALPPNWLHIPIGYNGRASTVVVSGTEIVRPNGQTKAPDAALPSFGPSKRLDIELEMGAIVGGSSQMGQPLTVAEADEMIFGYVLLNDWSARDIQAWEYQPLGPFQAKAFATSISPWIVTKAALEPFRTSTLEREINLLPYLNEQTPMLYDIDLSVTLQPEGQVPTTIARTNYNQMYYSAAQQLAHHASSGCAMNSGDLLGSGTISGPEKSQRGSLLEMSWGGEEPLMLDCGKTRTFIEDGDTLTLHGAAKGDGYQIGFGECIGTIKPALPFGRPGDC